MNPKIKCQIPKIAAAMFTITVFTAAIATNPDAKPPAFSPRVTAFGSLNGTHDEVTKLDPPTPAWVAGVAAVAVRVTPRATPMMGRAYAATRAASAATARAARKTWELTKKINNFVNAVGDDLGKKTKFTLITTPKYFDYLKEKIAETGDGSASLTDESSANMVVSNDVIFERDWRIEASRNKDFGPSFEARIVSDLSPARF